MQTTYGLLEPFHYGRGYQEPVFPANPAAGAGFTHLVKGQNVTRLIACAFQLATSSNAGNRFVTLTYETGNGNIWGADGAAVAVAASTTSQQFFGSYRTGTSSNVAGSAIFFPLSGILLSPGSKIVFGVANIDTTDQLAAIGLLFERFELDESGYVVGGQTTEAHTLWVADHYG